MKTGCGTGSHSCLWWWSKTSRQEIESLLDDPDGNGTVTGLQHYFNRICSLNVGREKQELKNEGGSDTVGKWK